MPTCLMGEEWGTPRNMGLISSSRKKCCFSTVFNNACAEMNTRKWPCSYPSTVSPQSRDRLLASLSSTVAKSEASVTYLQGFFTTPCGACGNGLEWLQKCAEQPGPWPKASQLASSLLSRSQASGKWCSCKNCWGQQLKSALCWVLRYFPPGPRQKLPRQIEVRTF